MMQKNNPEKDCFLKINIYFPFQTREARRFLSVPLGHALGYSLIEPFRKEPLEAITRKTYYSVINLSYFINIPKGLPTGKKILPKCVFSTEAAEP